MSDTVEAVKAAKSASVRLAALGTETKDSALKAMASALDANRAEILSANASDMAAAEGKLSKEMLKRLLVTDAKIDEMIASLESVISCEDPVGRTMDSVIMDDGLTMYQVRCPIGLIGIVFESRPDVIPQIMSLCLKSGNAVCFKGGSEALNSNRTLFRILRDAAASAGVPAEGFVLLESREDISEILELDKYIDLLIPRGSYSFVRYIQDNTRIPVLGHAAGICHVYVDAEADMKKALDVALDSKIQYPAVCNAAEKLLVDEKVASYFLPRIVDLYVSNGVEVRIQDGLQKYLVGFDVKVASEDDWYAEYDDLIIAVRTVKGVEEAVDFINSHGSHHSEAIITENRQTFDYFMRNVDSADILLNASTRFADGYRLGLGAEIGISTGKIHARGPMGMEGLMIYKYIIIGNGQVVKDYSGSGARKFKHRLTDDKLEMN
jgi:glutamate-5-semialdehyde dehydrogenase